MGHACVKRGTHRKELVDSGLVEREASLGEWHPLPSAKGGLLRELHFCGLLQTVVFVRADGAPWKRKHHAVGTLAILVNEGDCFLCVHNMRNEKGSSTNTKPSLDVYKRISTVVRDRLFAKHEWTNKHNGGNYHNIA